MAKYDKADLERRMKGAVEALRHDLAGLRTGRAGGITGGAGRHRRQRHRPS